MRNHEIIISWNNLKLFSRKITLIHQTNNKKLIDNLTQQVFPNIYNTIKFLAGWAHKLCLP